MEKIKSVVTGDAYKKPAKTEAGAFTTQDADNAATTAGTSAEDPNIPGSGKMGGVQGQVDSKVDQFASKEGVPKGADATINKEINKEI